MKEQQFKNKLTQELRLLKAFVTPIENAVSSGCPDLYVETDCHLLWIECKADASVRSDLSTLLRKAQFVWHYRQKNPYTRTLICGTYKGSFFAYPARSGKCTNHDDAHILCAPEPGSLMKFEKISDMAKYINNINRKDPC